MISKIMRLISFLIFLCISVMPVMAQVAVEAEISSVQMLIGEQVQIKLKLLYVLNLQAIL